MSADNGTPRPYSRGLTVAMDWAPDRCPAPLPFSCYSPGARAGNRWLPLLAEYDAYRVAYVEAAKAGQIPPAMDDRLLAALLAEIDALRPQIEGREAGPADGWLFDGIEAGQLVLAIWSASRLGDSDRGKSEPPSP